MIFAPKYKEWKYTADYRLVARLNNDDIIDLNLDAMDMGLQPINSFEDMTELLQNSINDSKFIAYVWLILNDWNYAYNWDNDLKEEKPVRDQGHLIISDEWVRDNFIRHESMDDLRISIGYDNVLMSLAQVEEQIEQGLKSKKYIEIFDSVIESPIDQLESRLTNFYKKG